MTLPLTGFRIISPATIEKAVAAREANVQSHFLAGGTDMVVNLRRGLHEPVVLVDLNGIAELGELECTARGARIGAGVRLATLAASGPIGVAYPAIRQAAVAIAGPSHRNLATVGGNLCLDTRCVYYNQSEWWRRANGYCLKHGGEVCHVAPQGNRCHAAFSGDLAPALLVLNAEVELAGIGRRRVPLADLYADDGRAHLQLAANELLVAVHLPPGQPPSAYAKARTRGSMDFPLAGAAVALGLEGGHMQDLRVALTGTNPRPLLLEGTARLLGRPLDAAALQALDKLVQKQAHPKRTTLASANYRRLAAAALVRKLATALAAPAGAPTP